MNGVWAFFTLLFKILDLVELIFGEVDVNNLYGIQKVDRGTVVVYFREVQRFTLSISNLPF